MRPGMRWRSPRRLRRFLLTACCVGRSASQMCLLFAAPRGLTAPTTLLRSAVQQCPCALRNSLAVFYPRPEIPDGLTLSDEVEYDLRVEEKRPLRRQPDDHHFWSLIMLAVMAGAFLLVAWVATKALFFFLKSLQSLENRLAKACPCFERLS